MTDPKEMRLLREKMNEEKKEELKKQDIRLNKLCFDYHEREKRIEELEKENAELKETLMTYNGCGDWDNDFHTCRVYLQHEELQMYIDQLTKAKEIIEKVAKMYRYSPRAEEIIEQAEQFLKEIEK